MSDTSLSHILILADDEFARRWEAFLHGPDMRIWRGREAIPSGERPEIIITNSHAATAAPRDAVGIIRVGGDGPADVLLPENCSAAELQLACRLLLEIVRLRQRERIAAETERALSQAAMTDPLTGLPNRRAWDKAVAERLASVAASGPRLCMAILDIDQFKEINDTRGHVVGDKVLQAVGHAIQDCLRHGDFIARLGGDEFGLLLPGPGEAEAAAIVERVLRGIAGHLLQSMNLSVTASSGFALTGGKTAVNSAESLYLAADNALIAAKRVGAPRA